VSNHSSGEIRVRELLDSIDSAAAQPAKSGIEWSWDELVFFCLLLDVTNLLGDLLKAALVV